MTQRIFGYVTSRPFGKFVMPVPAQNACLRDYVRSVAGEYVLPPLEHKFENCYMQLFSVFENMKAGDTIAMYSLEIVAQSEKAVQLIAKNLSKKRKAYFVLENFLIEDVSSFRQIMINNRLSKFVLKRDVFAARIAG